MSELVALTCASGQQCGQLIPSLYDAHSETPRYKLRLVVNSESSFHQLKQHYPRAEVIIVDLQNISHCRLIVAGATTIYHVGPSFHPHEMQIGLNVIDAAVAEARKEGSKFKHFVYSSVLNPQFSKMLNHDRKKYVEEYLMESPLNWTILQPAHFMDTTVGALFSQRDADKPVFSAPFDPRVAFSLIALRDLGAAAVKVITERERHYYAMYPLTSTGPIPYHEFVDAVRKELGVTVNIKELPLQEAVDKLCEQLYGTKDVDQRVRDGPERMLLFYDKRGLVGNPNVLRWLLGREPTTIADLVRIRLDGVATGVVSGK